MLSADQFKYIVLGVAALVIVGGSAALVPSQRRHILKKLAGRRPLTDDEFRALFSPPDAEVAVTIRDQLKGYLGIPVALVHPDDKLCADVGLGTRDGLDANCFVQDVERATGTTITGIDAEKLYTLRDIVVYVSGRESVGRGTMSPESSRS
jgi:hypothetical protein